MNNIGPVVAKLSYTVFCVLRSVRISDRRQAEKQRVKQSTVYLQAICIETAVAATLLIYSGWLCFRKWYFDELIVTSNNMIITSNNMLLGCFLVLVAALGTKLCWTIWSAFNK